MYQCRATLLAFALVACGDANVPTKGEATAQGVMDDGLERDSYGQVAYAFDASELTRAETQIAVPPSMSTTVTAVKFIPASLSRTMASSECSFGAPRDGSHCSASEEVGLAIALLDRPYAAYAAELRSSGEGSLEPDVVSGVEGLAYTRTTERATTRYTFLPQRDRTLLLVDRTNPDVDAGFAALGEVRRSLMFEPLRN
ncbi:MAG: hypothetical protein WBA68_13820 [Alteraurantiacibacter sp.]